MKTRNVTTMLFELLLLGLLLSSTAIAQGPADPNLARWTNWMVYANQLDGYGSMIASAPNPSPAQHVWWVMETKPWCAVCGGDPASGQSAWSASGWSVAVFRYLLQAPVYIYTPALRYTMQPKGLYSGVN